MLHTKIPLGSVLILWRGWGGLDLEALCRASLRKRVHSGSSDLEALFRESSSYRIYSVEAREAGSDLEI